MVLDASKFLDVNSPSSLIQVGDPNTNDPTKTAQLNQTKPASDVNKNKLTL